MTDKFIAITGATGGLGSFLVESFLNKNTHVLAISKDKRKLEDLKKKFSTNKQSRLDLYQCDLSLSSSVSNFCHTLQKNYSHLDVFINNAAIQGPIGPFIDNDFDHWVKTIQINLIASAQISKCVLKNMLIKNSGSLINLSGGGATKYRKNFSAYAVSKVAIVRLTETLAKEYEHSNIKINAVAPGAMPTKMLKQIIDESVENSTDEEKYIAEKAFLDKACSFRKVFQLIHFLSSSQSNGISGKLISAIWDDYNSWPKNKKLIMNSDLFTLRRIVENDRNL